MTTGESESSERCACPPAHGVGYTIHQQPCEFATSDGSASVEHLADRLPREHTGDLCTLDHICPACKFPASNSPCMDLFEHDPCGWVACCADEP